MSDPQIQARLRQLAQQNAAQGSGVGSMLKKAAKSVAHTVTQPGVLSTAALLTGNPNAALAARTLGYGLEGGYYRQDSQGNFVLVKSRKTVPPKWRGVEHSGKYYNDDDLPMTAYVVDKPLSMYQQFVKDNYHDIFNIIEESGEYDHLTVPEKRGQTMKIIAGMWKNYKIENNIAVTPRTPKSSRSRASSSRR